MTVLGLVETPKHVGNLLQSDTPESHHATVCIVGGGVAGQTLALELSKFNIDNIIIESGGTKFNRETQNLAKGENSGENYYDLSRSRLRLFGGTAAIWGGRCAELDPIDFQKRPYLPHSGWPITKSDLAPYYANIFDSLGLQQPSEGRLYRQLKLSRPPFDQRKLDTDFWAFDEYGERFTKLARCQSSKTTILLNANITSINLGTQSDVQSLTARSINGNETKVTANYFVLAAGGIETNRLLLGAVPLRPNGLGNDKGVLGRFFMEHPHARGGEIFPENIAKTLALLPRALRIKGRRYAGYLRPAPELQYEQGILNSSVSIAPRRKVGEKPELFRMATNQLKETLPSTRLYRGSYKAAKHLAIKALEKTDPWSSILNMKLSKGKVGIFAVVRAEQAPNPNSRLTLSCHKDALGLRQVKLNWQFSDIDRKSIHVLMNTLRTEFSRLDLGKVVPSSWLGDSGIKWKTDNLISAHPIGGYHHMGGTRMSDTPQTGVVDANCKLHESPNLFVASSSVFPTSGWANPTITIMALAQRLGHHLKDIID